MRFLLFNLVISFCLAMFVLRRLRQGINEKKKRFGFWSHGVLGEDEETSIEAGSFLLFFSQTGKQSSVTMYKYYCYKYRIG